jgi:hypothetical protein
LRTRFRRKVRTILSSQRSNDWEIWDPPDIQGFWNGCFDHNNRPVYYNFLDSDVNPGRQWKLLYRWWNEDNKQWNSEFVCDPAGSMTFSVVRPDGVTQLSTQDEEISMAESVDYYGHFIVRATDGSWTEVLHFIGYIGFNYSQPYWGEEWAWTGGLEYGKSPYEDTGAFTYGTGGYTFFDKQDMLIATDGRLVKPSWPSEQGGYHSPCNYIHADNGLVKCSYGHSEYTHWNSDVSEAGRFSPRFGAVAYDKSTGWYAAFAHYIDRITSNQNTYLYVSGIEDNMYQLDW